MAAALFFVGIAAFFASNTAFPMLSLSSRYALTASEVEQAALVAAGQSLIAIFNENAFHVSYAIVSVSWLLMSIVMLRSERFGRTTSSAGTAAGGAGIVAVVLELSSTATRQLAIVLYFGAIVFLLLWVSLAGRRLWTLGRSFSSHPPGGPHG